MINKKFVLNPECFLIRGAKRGAIYDLNVGHVYSIDRDSSEILHLSEQGYPIGKIIHFLHQSVIEKDIIGFFKNLISLDLGKIVEIDFFPKKISLIPNKRKLDFVWVELTQGCNLRCLHCYSNCGSKKIFKKYEMNLDFWEDIIRQSFDLDCRKIQFIGGEPLLFGKGIYQLIELSLNLGYELVEIFTNATLLTEEDINRLSKYEIQVATSLYSKRPEIHDSITRKRGSFEKTVRNVKSLRDKGIKVRSAVVVMKQNEGYLEETIDFVKKIAIIDSKKPFDLARPVGAGQNEEISSERFGLWRLRKKPVFHKITREEFIRNLNGNSCWRGKICFTSNGLAIPCIMARNEIYGDVKKRSLKSIIRGKKLKRAWNLSKDHVKICQDCEFRYICFDCRPLVKGGSGDLRARGNDCLYNPYLGEWENS